MSFEVGDSNDRRATEEEEEEEEEGGREVNYKRKVMPTPQDAGRTEERGGGGEDEEIEEREKGIDDHYMNKESVTMTWGEGRGPQQGHSSQTVVDMSEEDKVICTGFTTSGLKCSIKVPEGAVGMRANVLRERTNVGEFNGGTIGRGNNNVGRASRARGEKGESAEQGKEINENVTKGTGNQQIKTGFATAGGGRDITVDEDCLRNAGRVVGGETNQRSEGKDIKAKVKMIKTGFATAGGGIGIEVYEESLRNAGKVMGKEVTTMVKVKTGFVTAGGGPNITVDEDAVRRGAKCLKEKGGCERPPTSTPAIITGCREKSNSTSNKIPTGFATAGGGVSIKVNEEMIGNSDRILKQTTPELLPVGKTNGENGGR